MLDNCPLSMPRNQKESQGRVCAADCIEKAFPNVQRAGQSGDELSDEVLGYLENNLSENTHRAYAADMKHFEGWGGVIPASEAMVANYLAAYAGQLTCATLERRLATLSKMHHTHGLPNPVGSDLVRSTMRGIKRKHGVDQRQARPLLAEQLFEIIDGLGNSPRDVRDKALLLIGFSGAFRRSELIKINVEDLEWYPDGMIVRLRSSKTDQMKKGRLVPIRKTDNGHCPNASLRNWLEITQATSGPLFRSINRHGQASLKRLSAGSVSRIIKERVTMIGLDGEEYSGHSLRAGYVTSAAHAGIPAWAIKRQTGHVSDAMLACYIRPSLDHSMNIGRPISQSNPMTNFYNSVFKESQKYK